MRKIAATLFAASLMIGTAAAQNKTLEGRVPADRAAYCFATNYQLTNALEFSIFSSVPEEKRAAVKSEEEFTALMKEHLTPEAQKVLAEQQSVTMIWANLYKAANPDGGEEAFNTAVNTQLQKLQAKGAENNITWDQAASSEEQFTKTVAFLQGEARDCFAQLQSVYPELFEPVQELPVQ